MKKSFLIIFFVSLGQIPAWAQRDADDPDFAPATAAAQLEAAAKLAAVEVKSFEYSNRDGKVYVIVRNDGHTNGLPMVVELRSHCQKGDVEWTKLEITDQEAICKYVPGTLAFDAKKQEVHFRALMPDGERYDRDYAKDPLKAEVHCKTKPQTVRIPVKYHCMEPED